MKAIRIHEFGGVDVLRWEEVPQPKPRPHQVLIKVDSAGVNYADVMRRGGTHPGGALPSSLGIESAGDIADMGEYFLGLARAFARGEDGIAVGSAGRR